VMLKMLSKDLMELILAEKEGESELSGQRCADVEKSIAPLALDNLSLVLLNYHIHYFSGGSHCWSKRQLKEISNQCKTDQNLVCYQL